MAGLFFASDFDVRVDEATSEMLPGAESDVAANLEISDLVRSRQVAPRDAVRALRRRLVHPNPNVRLLALALTDTCAKNAGLPFLREMASRDLVDVLVALCGPSRRPAADGSGSVLVAAREPGVLQHPAVSRAAQRLVVAWAAMCAPIADLQYLPEAVAAARRDGVPLPEAVPADVAALPIADAAAPPEWTDSDECERCRDAFSLLQRKHHCRRCGRTFCHSCSSRTLALPELGLSAPVRVCETCYGEKTDASLAKAAASARCADAALPQPAGARPAPPDAELARAIEMSLAEKRHAPTAGYDEEAALAAAIAASLQEPPRRSPAAQSPTPPAASPPPPAEANAHMALTPMERENVALFAEIAQRADAASLGADPELAQLVADMAALRDRLLGTRAASLSAAASRDTERVISVLQTALGIIAMKQKTHAAPLPADASVRHGAHAAPTGRSAAAPDAQAPLKGAVPLGPSCPDTFHLRTQQAQPQQPPDDDRPLIEL